MKFLCLHGLRHNGVKLKKSMDTFIRKCKGKGIEFVFIDSPFLYSDEEKDLRKWYSASKENIFTLDKYDTLQESLKYVKEKYEEYKCDSLIGFSQGANIVQVLLYQGLKVDKVILVSPFLVTDKSVELKKV
jgi:predicted esterase